MRPDDLTLTSMKIIRCKKKEVLFTIQNVCGLKYDTEKLNKPYSIYSKKKEVSEITKNQHNGDVVMEFENGKK